MTEPEKQDPIPDENRTKAKQVVASHTPSIEEAGRMALIRDAGAELIATILTHTPVGADQQTAIRKAREAVMAANAGIALRGTSPTRD
ncbi:MAG: hypothetical protein ACE5F1_01015 [Planctomycetota bacterium]